MTNIPTKLIERRVELQRQADDLHQARRALNREIWVTFARLEEADFAIAAYADCAASAEAGEGETASAAVTGCPGVESAPAGSAAAAGVDPGWPTSLANGPPPVHPNETTYTSYARVNVGAHRYPPLGGPAKKPRTPKRGG